MKTIERSFATLLLLTAAAAVAAGQNDSGARSDIVGEPVSFKVKRSQTGNKYTGVLAVGRLSVSYSEVESQKPASPLTCSEFLDGASVRKDKVGSALIMPANWGSRALWPDAAAGLSPEAVLDRIKAECSRPGSSLELAFSNGVSYQITWMEHGRGRAHLKRSDGSISVSRFRISSSDKKYSARNLNYSCSDLGAVAPRSTRDCKDCLVVSGDEYVFNSADRSVPNSSMLKGIKDACAVQEAGHKKELIEEARREVVRQAEEARRRAEESARRVAEFRAAIRSVVHAAQEADPFSSIRSGFDPSGPGGLYWQPTVQIPGAEKCALLNTPASTHSALAVWAFACRFTSGWPSASDFGEEPMATSVGAALGLPRTGEGTAPNKPLFFSDPANPTWRLYVARIDDGTVGVSILATKHGTVQPGSATAGGFSWAPLMLLVEPRCGEYKKREDERNRQQSEIKALGAELNDLQRRYQDALTEAMGADQRAISNCSGGAGFLGALKEVACFADRTTSQQKRAEAQQLTFTMNQKQSQMTSAQVSLATLAPSPLPPGCRTDGTAIVALPGSSPTESRVSAGPSVHAIAPSSSQMGLSVSEQPTVHDLVEKIRSGNHGPMPVAQRVTVNARAASGRTTMTVKNSTAYELFVFFDGPVSTKLEIMPGISQDVELVPGTFHLAGRVTADDVLPFYGEATYAGSASYSVTFYIAP
jgi:hypothetical protein